MPGTFSQLYIQVVFAVKGRENLIAKTRKNELHRYIALHVWRKISGAKPGWRTGCKTVGADKNGESKERKATKIPKGWYNYNKQTKTETNPEGVIWL